MSLQRLQDPGVAQLWCADQQARGLRVGLVPTMGALHEGHVSLVKRAAAETDRVCVSLFVNPLQFGEAQDFERYPRDFTADCDLLAEAGAHMAFTGSLDQFFPDRPGQVSEWEPSDFEDPGPYAEGLEGAFRPGHFEGVATIVRRLFEVCLPERAYFGAKDYQQTLVVRDLARRMGYPEVVVCPTLREASGLARSSRNELLNPEERSAGLFLSRALYAARGLWMLGERDPMAFEALMGSVLGQSPLEVEYATVRDPKAWTPGRPIPPLRQAVALIAARAGSVRLIDNMELDAGEGPAGAASRSLPGESDR